jgi:hypothetical protein
MRLAPIFGIAAAFAFVGIAVFAVKAQPITPDGQAAQVVFVCRNGVSMSVWSTAYFNRLAAERGLRERAIARAAIPSYTSVPLRMQFALAVDGFRLNGYQPEVVSPDDVLGAEHVVIVQGTDDTTLPPEIQEKVRDGEVWQGFSPMREDYFPARAALQTKVEELIERLAANAEAPIGERSSR